MDTGCRAKILCRMEVPSAGSRERLGVFLANFSGKSLTGAAIRGHGPPPLIFDLLIWINRTQMSTAQNWRIALRE
jgi:hypothetical protein